MVKNASYGIVWMLFATLASPLGASGLAVDDELSNEAARVQKALAVLQSIMAAPDKGIPEDLLAKAEGIAVIPNVVKGAFIAGGQFGKGLVAAREDSGKWRTPSFVDLGGGSFGLQAGVEATDLILVFTARDGLREMMKDNLKLGVDAAAVAGPVGRHVEVGSNVTLDSPIYSYSRNKGVFAGVSVSGSVLTIDDSANHIVYGEGVTGTDILFNSSVRPHRVTKPFVDALNRYAPRRSS